MVKSNFFKKALSFFSLAVVRDYNILELCCSINTCDIPEICKLELNPKSICVKLIEHITFPQLGFEN